MKKIRKILVKGFSVFVFVFAFVLLIGNVVNKSYKYSLEDNVVTNEKKGLINDEDSTTKTSKMGDFSSSISNYDLSIYVSSYGNGTHSIFLYSGTTKLSGSNSYSSLSYIDNYVNGLSKGDYDHLFTWSDIYSIGIIFDNAIFKNTCLSWNFDISDRFANKSITITGAIDDESYQDSSDVITIDIKGDVYSNNEFYLYFEDFTYSAPKKDSGDPITIFTDSEVSEWEDYEIYFYNVNITGGYTSIYIYNSNSYYKNSSIEFYDVTCDRIYVSNCYINDITNLTVYNELYSCDDTYLYFDHDSYETYNINKMVLDSSSDVRIVGWISSTQESPFIIGELEVKNGSKISIESSSETSDSLGYVKVEKATLCQNAVDWGNGVRGYIHNISYISTLYVDSAEVQVITMENSSTAWNQHFSANTSNYFKIMCYGASVRLAGTRKYAGSISVDMQATCLAYKSTYNVKVANVTGTGTLSVKSSAGTVSISNGVISLYNYSNLALGTTVTITITAAESTGYYSTSKTISLVVKESTYENFFGSVYREADSTFGGNVWTVLYTASNTAKPWTFSGKIANGTTKSYNYATIQECYDACYTDYAGYPRYNLFKSASGNINLTGQELVFKHNISVFQSDWYYFYSDTTIVKNDNNTFLTFNFSNSTSNYSLTAFICFHDVTCAGKFLYIDSYNANTNIYYDFYIDGNYTNSTDSTYGILFHNYAGGFNYNCENANMSFDSYYDVYKSPINVNGEIYYDDSSSGDLNGYYGLNVSSVYTYDNVYIELYGNDEAPLVIDYFEFSDNDVYVYAGETYDSLVINNAIIHDPFKWESGRGTLNNVYRTGYSGYTTSSSYGTTEDLLIAYYINNINDILVTCIDDMEYYYVGDAYDEYELYVTRNTGYINNMPTSVSIPYGDTSKVITLGTFTGTKLIVSDNNSVATTSVSGSNLTINIPSKINAGTSFTVTVGTYSTNSHTAISKTITVTISKVAIDVVLSANDIGPFKYGVDYSSSLGYTPSASLKWGDSISAITVSGTPLYEYCHENQDSYTSDKPIAVGNHGYRVCDTSGLTFSSTNYTLGSYCEFPAGYLIIEKGNAIAYIKPGDVNKFYDGTSTVEQTFTISAKDADENEIDSAMYSYEGTPTFMYPDNIVAPINVGSYKIIVSEGTLDINSDYYYFTFNYSGTGTLTIAKAQLTKPTTNTTTFTYTGKPQTYTPTNYDSSKMNISNNVQTSANTYIVTVSLKDAANYEWKGTDKSNPAYEFKINKAIVNVSIIPTSEIKVYTGSPAAVSGDYTKNPSGLVNGETIDVITFAGAPVFKYPDTTTPPTEVGIYTINCEKGTLSGTADNYVVNFVFNETGTLTITKASLIKPTNNNTVFTYTGEYQTYIPTGYDSTYMTISNNVKLNADKYIVTVSIADPTNYKWSVEDQTDPTFAFEINKAEVTVDIVAINENHNYSGSNITPNKDWDPNNYVGLVNNEAGSSVITITGTPQFVYKLNGIATTPKNAGTYVISISKGTLEYSSTNYTVTFKYVDGELNVLKIEGTLELSSLSGTVNYPNEYKLSVKTNTSGGTVTAPTYTFAKVTIVNNTDITITPLTTVDTGVITFTASATDNFNSATATFTITINKGKIEVVVVPYEAVYDGDYHSILVSASPTSTIEYSETEGNYSSKLPSYKDVGTYTTYYKVSCGAYYEEVTGSSIVKITLRDLNVYVNIDTQSTTYTGSGISFTKTPGYSIARYDNLVAGDTISFSTPEWIYLDSKGDKMTSLPVDCGAYGISTENLEGSNKNYNVNVVINNGSLVITKVSIVIPTALDTSPVYDASEHIYTPKNYDSTKMTKSNDVYKDAGEYTLIVSLKDTTNYEWANGSISNQTVKFYVLQRTIDKIEVIVNSQEDEYDGEVKYEKFYHLATDTVLAGNDDVNDSELIAHSGSIKWYVDGVEEGWLPDVKDYSITIKGLVLSSTNYIINTIVITAGTYRITPASIAEVTLDSPLTKVYDGTALYVGIKSAKTENSQIYTVKYTVDSVESTDKPGRIDAGTTTVNYVISAPNHNDYSGVYQIIITKADLGVTLTVDNQTSVYTGTLTHTETYKLSLSENYGLALRDQSTPLDELVSLDGNEYYTFDGKKDMPQNVGTYVISMVDAKLLADNYDIVLTIVNGELKITNATMTVVVSDLKHTYDGTAKTPTFTVTTVDSCIYTIAYTPNNQLINVGKYTISYKISAPNHEDYNDEFTLEIIKKNLIVKVSPVAYSTTYNSLTNYPNTYDINGYEGLVAGENGAELIRFNETNLTFLFGTSTNNLTTVEPVNANEVGYVVSLQGLAADADNYEVDIIVTNSTYIIYKKSISTATITITQENVVYDGTEQKPTYKVSIILVEEPKLEVELTLSQDYTVAYSNNVNASAEALITITGINNFKDSASKKFTINKAQLSTLAPELKTITANVLKIENSIARLTMLSDITLPSNSNASWTFNSAYNLSNPIYVAGSNVHTLEFNVVCNPVNTNYAVINDVLTINLEKNEVSFKPLDSITEIYDRNIVNVVSSNYVNYYNSLYNSVPTVTYTLDGKTVASNNVINVGEYKFKLSCIENEYYLAAETTDTGTIIISPRNVDTLTFTDISKDIFEYKNAQHKPEVFAYYGTYELNSESENEITTEYGANINVAEGGQVILTGNGNYTGTKIITFNITARSIENATIASIPSQKYTGKEIKPTLTVTDAAINKVLIVEVDFTNIKYTHNVEPGTATVEITGTGNYVNSIDTTFIIVVGDMDGIPDLSSVILESTVDSLLSSLQSKLSQYDTQDGYFIFWNISTNEAYSDTQIVSNQTGNVLFGIKFVPHNENYSEATSNIQVKVVLNPSYIKIDNATLIKPTYDTNRVTSNDIISSRYEDKDLSISCVDTDTLGNPDLVSVTYKYYSFDNVNYNEIQAPKDAGEYYVKAFFEANRKYAASESEYTKFTIGRKNISDTDVNVEFTDQLDGTVMDYEYEGIAINPNFVISYNNDAKFNLITVDYIKIGTYNNIELGTANDQYGPHIEIEGKGNYIGTRYIGFNIVQKDISKLSIESIADQYYTGSEINPDVVIYHNNIQLVVDVDFTKDSQNNKEVGIATITVYGVGNYTGTNSVNFNITMVTIPTEYLSELKNQRATVGTLLADIDLGGNTYGEWVFVLLDNNPNATVGLANPLGNRFTVEFRDFNGEYKPYADTVSIIVTKNVATLKFISSLNKVYDFSTIDYTQAIEYNGDTTTPTITPVFTQNGVVVNNPINAGTYTLELTVAETDAYESATASQTFTISKAIIGSENVVINEIEPMKLGTPATQLIPSLTIVHTVGNNTRILVENVDFTTIAGANNTAGENTGVMYVLGMGNYTTNSAFETALFNIIKDNDPRDKDSDEPITITIVLKEATYIYYDSTEKKPEILVYKELEDGSQVLINASYYTVEYSDNINASKNATVTITFTEESPYKGSKSQKFEILPYVLTGDNITNVDPTAQTFEIVTGIGSGTDGIMVEGIDYQQKPQEDGSILITGINNFTTSEEGLYVEFTVEPTVFTLIKENTHYTFATYNKKWVDQNEHTYNASKITYLRYVSQGENVVNFLTQFENSTSRIKAFYCDGTEVALTNKRMRVRNGMIFNLYDSSNQIIDSFTVNIAGDVDCDGTVGNEDAKFAIEHLTANTFKQLDEHVQLAFDVDYNGRINSSDKNIFNDILYINYELNKDYKLQ